MTKYLQRGLGFIIVSIFFFAGTDVSAKYARYGERKLFFSERGYYNIKSYQGNVDSEGKPHGKGIMGIYKKNGEVLTFKGNFRHGHPHGFGTLSYPGGGKYVGYMANGERDGFGKIYNKTGKVTFGGTFNGGSIVRGKRFYGMDKFQFMYQGEFSDFKFHGKGKKYRLYYYDPKNFLKSIPSKRPILIEEGTYRYGKLHGMCREYHLFSDPKKPPLLSYYGKFKNGKKHGPGTEYDKKGKAAKVYYWEDEKVKTATLEISANVSFPTISLPFCYDGKSFSKSHVKVTVVAEKYLRVRVSKSDYHGEYFSLRLAPGEHKTLKIDLRRDRRKDIYRRESLFRIGYGGLGVMRTGNSDLERYYGSGHAVMLDWMWLRRHRPGKIYGWDLYMRFTYRYFAIDGATVAGTTMTEAAMHIPSLDFGFRFSLGSYLLWEKWDIYGLGAFRLVRVTEKAENGISNNFFTFGFIWGGGIEVSLINRMGLFIEYNSGSTRIGEAGRNIEGHQLYMGLTYRGLR